MSYKFAIKKIMCIRYSTIYEIDCCVKHSFDTLSCYIWSEIEKHVENIPEFCTCHSTTNLNQFVLWFNLLLIRFCSSANEKNANEEGYTRSSVIFQEVISFLAAHD